MWKWISRFNWFLTHLLFIACAFALLRKCWGHSRVIKSWAVIQLPTHFSELWPLAVVADFVTHSAHPQVAAGQLHVTAWPEDQQDLLQDQVWCGPFPSKCQFLPYFAIMTIAFIPHSWVDELFYIYMVVFVVLQDFCNGMSCHLYWMQQITFVPLFVLWLRRKTSSPTTFTSGINNWISLDLSDYLGKETFKVMLNWFKIKYNLIAIS